MTHDTLSDFVEVTASKLEVPGVAVGVWADGREIYACRGVTSVDNPLPVDQDTLFLLASATKTFTATALMRLVTQGRVVLDAPVRRYVPELVLPDDRAAAEVTVLQLLNHTAGLNWRLPVDTGDGDDALARYVAAMAESELIASPGTRASYSQVGYNLAGRIVEKVTGLTYERAVVSLLLDPLGLSHSFFTPGEAMTRRFVVGHNRDQDGALRVARQWKDTRGDNPGSGLASSVADRIRWARFHLGDGRADNDVQVLPAEVLHRMRQQTVELRTGTLGEAMGICWFLRDIDGVHTVGHAGSANGQFTELLLVPARNFAVVALSNAGPDGGLAFNHAAVRWALEHYLGLIDRDPEPLPYDEQGAREIVGRYENEVMRLTIATDGPGLTVECAIRPEVRAAADIELPPDLPPADLGLPSAGADEFIVTSGGLTGSRGFFTRTERGAIAGVDLGGRLFNRVASAPE